METIQNLFYVGAWFSRLLRRPNYLSENRMFFDDSSVVGGMEGRRHIVGERTQEGLRPRLKLAHLPQLVGDQDNICGFLAVGQPSHSSEYRLVYSPVEVGRFQEQQITSHGRVNEYRAKD